MWRCSTEGFPRKPCTWLLSTTPRARWLGGVFIKTPGVKPRLTWPHLALRGVINNPEPKPILGTPPTTWPSYALRCLPNPWAWGSGEGGGRTHVFCKLDTQATGVDTVRHTVRNRFIVRHTVRIDSSCVQCSPHTVRNRFIVWHTVRIDSSCVQFH